MLSHYNIGSNIEQMEQVLGLGARGPIAGPYCHSSIRSASQARCVCQRPLGVGVVYHPNPLDAKTIGPLVSETW